MTKVWLLLLFIRADVPNASGPAITIGDYPTLAACQGAASTATMLPDEDPRDWQPLVAQWVCVERPPQIAARN